MGKIAKQARIPGTIRAARRPHSIRLSDSEWTQIEDAALRHGISAGEIVRSGALGAAGVLLGVEN